MVISEQMIRKTLAIAAEAGAEILEVYGEEFSVDIKSDNSPLTEADRRSHQVIADGLAEMTKDIPVLSEEGEIPGVELRRQWQYYWCIDPLDGTKEFVKRNGEFTVNIALMQRKVGEPAEWEPVFGVVYAPVNDEAYVGWMYEGGGEMAPGQAYRISELSDRLEFWREDARPLNPLVEITEENRPLQLVASRSHLNADTQNFIDALSERYGEAELLSYGSSYKLCKVASGAAHAYPRFAPTMEWDTAAADAVCRAAGAKVLNRETGKPLSYNKEELLNPHFLVTAVPEIAGMVP